MPVSTRRRTLGVLPLRRERHLDHRGNQGRRNAVAGHIGHEDADALGVHFQEIVEVARDSGHRPVSRGDGEAATSRHRLRQKRRLDLPRDGQLTIDDGQALGLGKHAPRRDGSEANDEDGEAERLEIRPRHVQRLMPRRLSATAVTDTASAPTRTVRSSRDGVRPGRKIQIRMPAKNPMAMTLFGDAAENGSPRMASDTMP